MLDVHWVARLFRHCTNKIFHFNQTYDKPSFPDPDDKFNTRLKGIEYDRLIRGINPLDTPFVFNFLNLD